MNYECYKSGQISLWDLPLKNVYVKLKSDFRKNLINNVKNKSKLSKECNIPYHVIKGFVYRNRSISLETLKKLVLFLSPNDVQTVEKNIEILVPKTAGKGIVSPKLPFNFCSESGAILISSLLHDGGIDKNKNSSYFNLDLKIRKKVLNAAEDIFGNFNSKVHDIKGTRLRFPRIVTHILVDCLKLRYGNKVYNDSVIPEFIFSSPHKIRSAFLRQSFDDDGYVHKNGIYLVAVKDFTGISTSRLKLIKRQRMIKFAPSILKIDKRMLETLGIKVSGIQIEERNIIKNSKLEKRLVWKLSLTKENIEKFYKKIGFDLEYRKERLNKIFSNYNEYKDKRYYPYEAESKILDIITHAQDDYGYFTSKIIKRYTNRTLILIDIRIKQLRDKGLIKAINKVGNTFVYRINK